MSCCLVDQDKVSRLINYTIKILTPFNPLATDLLLAYLPKEAREKIEALSLGGLTREMAIHKIIIKSNYEAFNYCYETNEETIYFYKYNQAFTNFWEALKFCDYVLYQMKQGQDFEKRLGYQIVKSIKQVIIEKQSEYQSAPWG